MTKKYHFTNEMLEDLKELYPTTLAAELAEKYNCSVKAIYRQAKKLRLEKSKEFIKEISRKSMENPNHPGRKYQFKKGQTPSNKGKKQTEYMSKEAIERTKGTRFSKGNVPPNRKPIGHKRITKDGYIEVKVRDLNKNENFELKHRLIWEKHNGPIPKGYNVQFKDGNKQNCKIENLKCISNAELAEMNRCTKYPAELQRAIKLNNKLRKQIKEND